ncbi:hypothetical protein IAU60_000245 [Kwoniella sp. DSM 27419]
MSTPSTSLLPLLAVGCILYHLSSQGTAMQTIWLMLNLLDTFRALRKVRANGRRIGIITRRRAMRDTLVCWVIFVLGQTAGSTVTLVLGWLPFYSLARASICCAFLFMRTAASVHLLTNLVSPLVKPYETPIDLSILLFEATTSLILLYGVQLPSLLLWSSLRSSTSALHHSVVSVRNGVGQAASTSSKGDGTPLSQPEQPPTLVELEELKALLSLGPPVPGSILLRHPTPQRPTLRGRRSIIFVSPPATPRIVHTVSPPSSPEPVIVQVFHDVAQPIVTPVTPRRPVPTHRLLDVPPVSTVRRSPRRHQAANIPREPNMDSLDLLARNSRAGPSSLPCSINPTANPGPSSDRVIHVIPTVTVPEGDLSGLRASDEPPPPGQREVDRLIAGLTKNRSKRPADLSDTASSSRAKAGPALKRKATMTTAESGTSRDTTKNTSGTAWGTGRTGQPLRAGSSASVSARGLKRATSTMIPLSEPPAPLSTKHSAAHVVLTEKRSSTGPTKGSQRQDATELIVPPFPAVRRKGGAKIEEEPVAQAKKPRLRVESVNSLPTRQPRETNANIVPAVGRKRRLPTSAAEEVLPKRTRKA